MKRESNLGGSLRESKIVRMPNIVIILTMIGFWLAAIITSARTKAVLDEKGVNGLSGYSDIAVRI